MKAILLISIVFASGGGQTSASGSWTFPGFRPTVAKSQVRTLPEVLP